MHGSIIRSGQCLSLGGNLRGWIKMRLCDWIREMQLIECLAAVMNVLLFFVRLFVSFVKKSGKFFAFGNRTSWR